MRVDDHLVLPQETVGNPHGLFQQAPWIAPQIQDKTCHPLLLQGAYALVQLALRGAREILDLDVAHSGTDEEGLADAVGRDVVARDGEVQNHRVAGPRHGNRHLRSLRSLEPPKGIVDGHVERVHALDLGDDVTGTDADVPRRRALEG